MRRVIQRKAEENEVPQKRYRQARSAHDGDIRMQKSQASAALTLPIRILLTACSFETEPQAAEALPVCTITVETRDAGTPIFLPGRIEAEDEVALGFRNAGRILDNNTMSEGSS